MDNRSEAKLRGPVRNVSSKHVFRETAMIRGEDYLLDGRLAKTVFRNTDGTESSTTYSYNPVGQLHQLMYWNKGVSNGTCDYRYDQQGRLAQISSIVPNGIKTVAETSSYDAQGRRTRISYTPDWSLILPKGHTIGFDSDDGGAAFMAAEPATMTTLYDERGLAQQTIAHNREHQLVATVDRIYNEQGHLTEVSTTIVKRGNKQIDEVLASASDEQRAALEKELDQIFPQGKPMSRTKYRYDDQGRIVELSRWISQMADDRVITTYNEQGDEQTVNESQLTYVYDRLNNWTEKRMLSAGQIQYTETRELTYW